MPSNGFGFSSVLTFLILLLAVIHQQSCRSQVSAGSIATVNDDSDDFEELGASRKSFDSTGEVDSSHDSRASDSNRKRAAKHPTVKKDLDANDDESENSGSSTSTKAPNEHEHDNENKKLGSTEAANNADTGEDENDDTASSGDDDSDDVQPTSTTSGPPRTSDDDSGDNHEVRQGSRAGDFEVAENTDPSDASITLTIRGDKRSKSKTGTTTTTKPPSFIVSSNGTSYISANGTIEPTISEKAKKLVDNSDELRNVLKVIQSKTALIKKSNVSSVVESIKKETKSSSVRVVSGDVDNVNGKLLMLSTTITPASRPLMTTTTSQRSKATIVPTSSSPKPTLISGHDTASTTTVKPTTTTTKSSNPAASTSHAPSGKPSDKPLGKSTPKPMKTTSTTASSSKTTTSKGSSTTPTSKPSTGSSSSPPASKTTTSKPPKGSSTTPPPSKTTTSKPMKATSTTTVASKSTTTVASKSTTTKASKTVSTSAQPAVIKSTTTTSRKPDRMSTTTTTRSPTNSNKPTLTPKPAGPASSTAPPTSHAPKPNYDDFKDSDRLLAVVLTKKGRFKGRRLNAKAIELIMKGKLSPEEESQLRKDKHIQVNVNNTYVFPAGNYYFPNAIRFAGFVSS